MSSSTSVVSYATHASRSHSAPAESFSEGSSRGRAFKPTSAETAKKVDDFYLQLESAIKRAKTDGVLLGPRPSTRVLSPFQLEPSKVPFTRPDAVLGALSELKLT